MAITTEALVHSELNGPAVLTSVTLPEPNAHEVVVRIVACGLCHSDVSSANGVLYSAFPTILGHEGAGYIEWVGSELSGLEVGDAVLLSFNYCQSCAPCKRKKPTLCPEWVSRNILRIRDGEKESYASAKIAAGKEGASNAGQEVWAGFFGQSAFSRRAVCAGTSCVKVPKDTDLKLFAPLGCGFQTGAGTVVNKLKPPRDTSILITGLGAVGMGALFAAVALGVQNIIVLDIIEARLDLAQKFGANHAINGNKVEGGKVVEAIRAVSPDGLGVDYAVECTGVRPVFTTVYESLAIGGHVVCCGVPPPGPFPDLTMEGLITVSKTIGGCVEGEAYPSQFVPYMMDLHSKGKFPLEDLVKYFKVEDYDAAVQGMKDGSVIKPVIVFE